eukprot:TRINITY_DN18782_c0_g1_i1.p1 TRINITY_DN18782_c0_g1~~TRINITY_DN18782_c0_g1_i1.p1  ORF type:complete len:197 (+),score=40.90 TRINITY_DN18782_c0_g1_i1:56-646(+)
MQNTKEEELEIELGMSLSDIISLDNESIPPTLPGTPNVQGNAMAQRKPKDVRLFQLEGKSQQPQQQQQQRKPPPQYNSHHQQQGNRHFQGGKNQSHNHGHSGFRNHNNSNDYNDNRRQQSPTNGHNHTRPNRSSSPPAGSPNYTNPTPTQLNYQNQQNQQRRKNRPQSWGGTSQSWRGSYSSDKVRISVLFSSFVI